MSLKKFLAVGLFFATVYCARAIAQDRPSPICDKQSGCSVEWAAQIDGNWKWISVQLNQSEADSLAAALKEASDKPLLHVHMMRQGDSLQFRADKESNETVEKLQTQALFRIKDFRFRVVPEGTAYPLLRTRMKG